MNKVLMTAFHYPPFQGSSGVLRTWNFSRYLPENGWSPLLLTANPLAYGPIEVRSGGLEIPPSLRVWRAMGFDTARHLAIRGRYLRWLALPDRWVSWYLPAVATALWIARSQRPQLIWSTYPISSAHLVGLTVQRLTGLPWIADFRDSMTEHNYPADPLERRLYRWIEAHAVRRAAAVVFTTEGTRRMYAERYGSDAAKRFHVIANGYAEEDFERAQKMLPAAAVARPKDAPLLLIHSGVLYPSERDPRPFLKALAELKAAGRVSAANLRVMFRASGHDALIQSLIDAEQLSDMVYLAPPLPYDSALAEMLQADALLLFQAANCNHQIPAKLYEYLRAQRPVFALTDFDGDTAAVLRACSIDTLANLAESSDIAAKLPIFLAALRAGTAPVATTNVVQKFSRRSQTCQLAELFDVTLGTARQHSSGQERVTRP